MGNKTSKLTDVQVNELEKITHLDGEEIKMWFANFIKESPNGVLDKSEFQNLFKIFFPFGESTRFSDYLFAVFDEDKNGVVDFKEFLLVFSKVSKGSFKEKAKLSFKFFDINADGWISKEDMLKIVDSVYKTIGNLTSLKPGEENAEKRVEKIFLNFDKDKDGLLDFNEFEEALKSDTDILNAFSIYD